MDAIVTRGAGCGCCGSSPIRLQASAAAAR